VVGGGGENDKVSIKKRGKEDPKKMSRKTRKTPLGSKNSAIPEASEQMKKGTDW